MITSSVNFSDPNPALLLVVVSASLNLLGSFIMTMMTLNCSGLGWSISSYLACVSPFQFSSVASVVSDPLRSL